MNTTKILIADDHALMRLGIRSMLELQPDMSVVGEAENGPDAVAATDRLKPDVVVLDLMMPGLSGANVTREIHQRHPSVRIFIHTSYGSSVEMARALENGAVGALMKSAPTERLLEGIRAVAAGGTFVAREIIDWIENDPIPAFTQKQLDVLHALSRGLSNKDIAHLLGISAAGVQKHLDALFAKLGAATWAEAVSIAFRRQILK